MAQVIAERYQILEKLGEGAMGIVYRGLDTNSTQVVAIKELNPLLTTPELIERFKREGEALRELNHPNIVKLLDTVEHDGAYYLVMEYVSGGDLHDLLKAGQLPIERCLKLALDLADALTRAHKLDIIHRDLKPANVLLAEDGTLRLSDFGVARMGQKARVTETDMIVGTVDYLSPETLDGAGIDTRADIWAFGVMLFEMLAGKRPFTGETLTATLTAILTQPVPDLEGLRPDAPVALIDLIYRMLEKEREARIRSVRQIGLELEDILQGRITQTPPQTRFAPPTPDFLQRPKHNLPAQTTPFVGREAELTELAKLLNDSKVRLITIVAQGGMGKTRLALEIGEQYVSPPQPFPEASGTGFKDGVYFVELAPLSDVANIVSAIAEAVSYQFQADGREQKQQVLDFLSNKNLLLVLDNYEHLLEGANLVTDILKAAPNVKMLATSRQRLNQSGETLFNLEGMDFPAWETPEDALEYAAVKLFMQSAKRAKPDFELNADNMGAIARICKLVQGLPLGIVLAAAWLPMLAPDEISAEITKSIDFLASDMGDIPERQRSIRAVFDYSWDLLTDNEQQVFMKLSVFRGGFTREAAETVAGANLRTLMSLMNKSLIQRNNSTGRYDIHELLRQYGEEQLTHTGWFDVANEQYVKFFAQFMRDRTLDIKGRRQLDSFKEIEADFDNIRAAWLNAVHHANYEALDNMMETLALFCDMRSKYQVGEDLFQKAIEQLSALNKEGVHPTFNRLQARFVQLWALPERHPVPDIIRQRLNGCITFAEGQDERETIALCWWLQGEVEKINDNWNEALDIYQKALLRYEQLDNDYYIGRCLRGVVHSLNMSGVANQGQTRELNQRHLKVTQSVGDRSGMAHALLYDSALVDYATGSQRLHEAANIWREMGDWKSLGIVLMFLAEDSYLTGSFDEARQMAGESQQLLRDTGWMEGTWEIGIDILLGLVAVTQADAVSGRLLLEPNLTQYQTDFDIDKYTLLKALATIALVLCAREKSGQLILAALRLVSEPFVPIAAAGCLAVIAVILADAGERERGTQLLGLAFTYADHFLMGWMRKLPLLNRLRDRLKTELGEEIYNAAWERGKSLNLETVIRELLAEFGGDA